MCFILAYLGFSCYIYFIMNITQTVEIPDSRRVIIEMPLQVPTGRARVEMKVIPFVKKDAKPDTDGKLRMTERELDEFLENAETPHTDALVGLLSGMGEIDLDEIRMERLAKHLK